MELKLLQEKNKTHSVFSLYEWRVGKDSKIYFLKINSDPEEILPEKATIPKTPDPKQNKPFKLDRLSRTFDNTDKFKLENFVITQWGLGKIIKKKNDSISVDIYGTRADFPKCEIKLNYTIDILVLIKETFYLMELKVDSSLSILKLKKK